MKHLLTIIAIVLAFACCTTEAERSRMSALLDRADSMNRAYIPMTDGIDSLLLEATHYYDRHGTANEQMRAHYLLGCAYRDKGEAPAALQSYQDAVDHADTLSSDCDYRRLMSVYGQMAELFHAQNLPEDEIEICDKYGQLALKMQDTLLYIRNMELMVKPYYIMGDTASVLRVIEQVKQLYEKYGCHQEAVASNGVAISIALNRGQYTYACELMREIETESDLFQKDGEIAKGREIYYDFKGRYFIGIDQLDSAEYYMRKLSNYPQYTKSVCRSMLSIYQLKRNTDSIVKYSRLYEDAVDTRNNAMRTDIVHQMSSLYNYQQFMKKADAESRKAERLWYYLLLSTFSIVLLILVAVIAGYILVQKKRRQEEETKEIRKDYDEAISKKDQLSIEMDMLRANHEQLVASEQEAKNKLETVKSNNNQLIQAREKEIAELNDKIRDYAQRLIHSDEMVGESPEFTLMIEEFHEKAERKRNTPLPTKQEWEHFLRLFAQTQPKAYAAIGREQTLSPQELRVCILLLLKFANSEVMALLNISSQSLTNVKSRINEKLFGISNASTLENKIKEIPIV